MKWNFFITQKLSYSIGWGDSQSLYVLSLFLKKERSYKSLPNAILALVISYQFVRLWFSLLLATLDSLHLTFSLPTCLFGF